MSGHIKTALTALAAALLLVACHNDDDTRSPSGSAAVATNTVTVTPSLGKIVNARVILRNARTGAEISTGNTGSAGKVTFSVPRSVDAVVVEVSGGPGASYFDEAKGSQPLPDTVTLRAAAPVSGDRDLGVSVLTEAAVQNAEGQAGGLSKPENIVKANQDVGVALGVPDIVQPPVLIGSDSDYQQLKDDAASRYALQLAALVKAASANVGGNQPALALLDKLADDLSDGVLDGKKGTAGLSDLPYSTLASVFAAGWQLAMQDVVNTLEQSAIKARLTTEVINKVDVKDVINGPVIGGDGVFGGDDKLPWKGQIYLLPPGIGNLPDFSTLNSIGTLFANRINIPKRSFTEGFPGVVDAEGNKVFEWFAIRYQGPLTILADGDYQFRTNSDDGSKLFIDGQLVVNNDGTHGDNSVSGQVHLMKGVHTLVVEYFQGPRENITLQVYGNKAGDPESTLTPILPEPVTPPPQTGDQ